MCLYVRSWASTSQTFRGRHLVLSSILPSVLLAARFPSLGFVRPHEFLCLPSRHQQVLQWATKKTPNNQLLPQVLTLLQNWHQVQAWTSAALISLLFSGCVFLKSDSLQLYKDYFGILRQAGFSKWVCFALIAKAQLLCLLVPYLENGLQLCAICTGNTKMCQKYKQLRAWGC